MQFSVIRKERESSMRAIPPFSTLRKERLLQRSNFSNEKALLCAIDHENVEVCWKSDLGAGGNLSSEIVFVLDDPL